MRMTILRTKGAKFFYIEGFDNGVWFVINFLPGHLGIFVELNFSKHSLSREEEPSLWEKQFRVN